jgi:hypothetical protein
MEDLLVVVFQTDSTRVVTYRQPLANLRLTLLQGMGTETDSFGDSTGTLAEIAA